MTTPRRLEANRQNALRSTGPKTEEGLEACRGNALRHGLRALQVVVRGESAAEWEAHREAVVADLAPWGAVELALAERVAAALWRLGRVVRHEADLIEDAQDEDEVRLAHERAAGRDGTKATETDLPTAADVAKAARAVAKAEEAVATHEAAAGFLEALPGLRDEEPVRDWSVYEPLLDVLLLDRKEGGTVFRTEDEPFVVRHVRALLRKRGEPAVVAEDVARFWRETEIPKLQAAAAQARDAHEVLVRRHAAALERVRRGRGLPAEPELAKVQRYEAHLERGLHKALDRLRDLQEARGAAPPRPPAVAVAVGSFGNFAAEAHEEGAGGREQTATISENPPGRGT